MASTAHNPDFVSKDPGAVRYLVDDGEILFYGSAVGVDSADGFLKNVVGATATLRFVGFVQEDKSIDGDVNDDKITGDGVDITALVSGIQRDVIVDVLTVNGVDDTDKLVYATDENTFTIVSNAAGAVGRILNVRVGTECKVRFNGVV